MTPLSYDLTRAAPERERERERGEKKRVGEKSGRLGKRYKFEEVFAVVTQ